MNDHTFNLVERASCIAPFLPESDYNNSVGYIPGRLCSTALGPSCCLPCPFTEWVYPDNFGALTTAAEWIAVVSTVFCLFLLASWAALPVEKTHRHYLSICLTFGVMLMSFGFVIPLAGRPNQCADAITPHGMKSSTVCGASGSFLILGGWCGVMWVFLRSMSLHLQICWQVVVGRNFMWFAQVAGWGIPILGLTMSLVFSGVSFRLGSTCHINHQNSLADLWIPLLVFAGLTIIIQLFTFAYCIKVYLASLADNSSSTEGSGLPSYSNSIRTMTPRQAYRRVRRVIQLQWRGIAIVLIICADVIFFSIVFVYLDNVVEHLHQRPENSMTWLQCLALSGGDKNQCLDEARNLTINEATVGAVLVLLAINGLWLLILLGRWSMVTGWIELLTPASYRNNKREFVSVDARLDDLKKDTRSYEMLSAGASHAGHSAKESGVITTTVGTKSGRMSPLSPISPSSQMSPMAPGSPDTIHSPAPVASLDALARFGERGDFDVSGGSSTPSGRRTPDYFGQTARYHAPSRSFSSPRPPSASPARWNAADSFAPPTSRSPPPRPHVVRSPSQDANGRYENMHPLSMNRI